MTHDEAIRKLNALTGNDPEDDHSDADDIILRYLRHHDAEEVADAWERACERVGFCYA